MQIVGIFFMLNNKSTFLVTNYFKSSLHQF